ncbi:unnamed protein product [Dicrocoelium dendriticum]|nr:unnamed protein product [Dicrocoelium dendriticum]
MQHPRDSPADQRNSHSPKTLDGHERVGPPTPGWALPRRTLGFLVGEDALLFSWDENRALEYGDGIDTSQAHRRSCSGGNVLSVYFLDRPDFRRLTGRPRRHIDDARWSKRSS